jgi:uncharacterized protein (DUF952 family)
MLLHLLKAEDWARAQQMGEYRPASLESEGFIHCSTPAQICATADRHYHAQPDLHVLLIDPARVKAEIRFENLEGREELFPHLYGALNLDAVTLVTPFPPRADGNFDLPLAVSTALDAAQKSDAPIFALIPAFNEHDHIGRVVASAAKYLPVLVVNDGSQDDTVEVARSAGAQAVISQYPNQGKGKALMNGFREALARGAQAVVMLDADGQHDPDEIPLFLDAYHQKGFDLIIGERDFSKMPWLRRNTNTIGRRMFSDALGLYVSDNQTGYRLVSARLMQAMLGSRETNFEFEVEMIVVCVLSGFQMGGVSIKTIYAGEHSHIKPLRHGYHFVRMCWQTYLRRKAFERQR